MGYEKQNFENNKTVLIAEHLDHIEDGIVANEEAIKKKAEGKHTHKKEEITDFPTSMTPTAHTHKKEEITDFPTSMTPTAHTHLMSHITDLKTKVWTLLYEDDSTETVEVCVK